MNRRAKRRPRVEDPPAPLRQRGLRAHLKRILVPIDFSRRVSAALGLAVSLAEQQGARIILLHVVEQYGRTSSFGEQKAMRSAKAKLERLANAVKPMSLIERVLVREGVPSAEIVRAANDQKVDLVALTRHERADLASLAMNHTAERVMREADCPVLSVPRNIRTGVKA